MSDDPTLVDTPTLVASIRRDISIANAKLREARAFLDQAVSTAWELDRRGEPVVFTDPQDASDLRPLHERIATKPKD